VVDRPALVEERHDDRDGRFVAFDPLIDLLAAREPEIEPEHIAVQEDNEDEQRYRERHCRVCTARAMPRADDYISNSPSFSVNLPTYRLAMTLQILTA